MKTLLALLLCSGLLVGCETTKPNHPPGWHDPLLDLPVGSQ